MRKWLDLGTAGVGLGERESIEDIAEERRVFIACFYNARVQNFKNGMQNSSLKQETIYDSFKIK